MTVSSDNNKNRYEGNGVTDTFAFVGRIFTEGDLVVQILTRSDDSVVETLTLDTDYSVSIVDDESASVVVVAGKIPSSTQDVLIYRAIGLVQSLNLPTGTRFPTSSVENALDKLTATVQDQQEELDRTFKSNIQSSGTTQGVGTLSAGEILQVSADGTEVITDGVTADDVSTVAASITNVATVAGSIASVNTVAGIDTEVASVAGDSADINILSPISADIQALADIEDGTDATDAIKTVATNVTAVAAVATNIDTVLQAAEAVASAMAFSFDSSTSMADPGTGDVRLNNANFASVTAVAIDALTAQAGNPDLSDFIASWDDSTNTSKGFLRFAKGGAPENFAIFEITAVADNAGWLQLAVTHVDSAGSFTNADTLYLTFTRTGDAGVSFTESDISGQTEGVISATDEIVYSDGSLKKDTVQGILDLVLSAVYPVGAYYLSDVSTNPSTVLGFGTWAAVEGKMLIGADGTYTAGSTGGSATTTQTTSTLASHNHSATTYDNASGGSRISSGSSGNTYSPSTNSAGGGSAMTTISPYRAVYIWRRTA